MAPIRILMLTAWPFRAPRHGGQLRAAAIAQAYRDAGHTVFSAALYDPADSTAEFCPDDVPITAEISRAMRPAAGEPDGDASTMVFWQAVAAARKSFRAYADVVRAAQPDVVQIEEPVLWPVVRRLRAEGLLGHATIAYSAHNFETTAWQSRRDAGATVSNATLRDMAELEREIAGAVDLVIAVSANDAQAFRALGATTVVVAANGCTLPPRLNTDILGAYIPPGSSYAMFVSSAHPPNAHALVTLAARATRHPLRHGEILICGRVGDLVRSSACYRQAQRVLDQARFVGWVDNDILAALYAGARAVILPKTLEGGSNLKTAEALASGRPVVATRLAFTGFEAFTDLPGVVIEDSPDRFWNAVDTLLSQPAASSRPSDAAAILSWEDCLQPMIAAAEAIAREPRA